MTGSKGDPRVHLLMNLVLSAAFATAAVWGLSFVGAIAFSWWTVGVAAGLLMILTHLVVQR